MKRRALETERWTQLIGLSIFGGIVFGILIDKHTLPVPVVHAEEVVATSTPVLVAQKVQIEIAYDKAGVERLIRATFPEEPNTAVAIAKAESELNTKAFNPEWHAGCMGSIGVFQIACVHNRSNPNALRDVEFNIKKARAIYLESKARTGNGWNAWGAWHDGRWKQYL